MGAFLDESLAFYASYHYNFLNKLVHIVCVWPIFWTAQIFFFYAPVPAGLAATIPNWTLVLSLLYGIFYFLVEQPGIVGPIASGLVAGGYVVTKQLFEAHTEVIWKYALAIHIFCWVCQIVAHQVFEKRSPAFLDNIIGAVFMAPLFVLLEIFFPLGYKHSLHREVEKKVVKNIAEFRKAQKNQ